MVGSERRLGDLHREAQLCPRTVQSTRALERPAQVAPPDADVMVVRTQGRLDDLHRPLQLGPRIVQIAEVLEDYAQVASPDADVMVVWAEHCFGDPYGLFQLRAGRVGLIHQPEHPTEVAAR